MPDSIHHARSRALLIATAVSLDPMIPAMPTAAGSLAEMREVLTDARLCRWPDTSVTSVTDASDAGKLMHTLRALAREAEETLLLYFAGPGILLSHGELYLGLAGRRPYDVEDSSLRYAQVRRAVLKSRARLKIVILDCSYSGRVIPSLPATWVAEMTSINATYVLTASDREADPGDATASAFTAELVATIRAGFPAARRPSPSMTFIRPWPLACSAPPAPNRESTDLAGELPFTRNAHYGSGPWRSGASSGQAVPLRQPALSRRRIIVMASGVVAAIGGTGGAIAAVELPSHAPGTSLSSRASGTPSRKPRTPPGHATEVALAGGGDRITRIAFTFAGHYLIGGSGRHRHPPRRKPAALGSHPAGPEGCTARTRQYRPRDRAAPRPDALCDGRR